MKGKKSNTDVGEISMDDLLNELSGKSPGSKVKPGSTIERLYKISTGSYILDRALDGGYVRGRLIEVFGGESLGKTTLGYAFLSSNPEGYAGFIDGESAYDKPTAEMYGVDTSKLVVQKPDYLEEAMEMTIKMVTSKHVKNVMFDSIAGLPPKVELEGSMEDHAVGKKAFRMGMLTRQLHHDAEENAATVFFINQIRESMDMFKPFSTPGGKALPFHASYRLWIKGAKPIEVGGVAIGHYMKVNIYKNKFGKGKFDVEIPLIYGYGISKEWEIMKLAEEGGILVKSGPWYKYEDESVAQGEYNMFQMLCDNPELFEEITDKVTTLFDCLKIVKS